MVNTEGESDVNIDVMLWYSNKSVEATTNHNWHVHLSTVHNDDCSSASGHYNPFNADVSSQVRYLHVAEYLYKFYYRL